MIDNLPPAPGVVGRICVDFDGVLAESNWPSPEIGEAIDTGVNIILTALELGYEVIVYTARPASHEARIWEWLKEQGLYGDVYDVVTGKPVADLYVDDKAYNPFLGEGVYGYREVRDLGAGAATSEAPSSDGVSSKAAGSFPTWEDEDPDEGMCPYCVTPWKCNGPPEDEPDDGWIQRMLKGVWG